MTAPAPWELRLGSCLDPITGLATLDDASVDHVITDPPYSRAVVGSARTGSGARRTGGQPRSLGYAGISDAERDAIAIQMARVARRWVIVFCDAESLHAWKVALEGGGLRHLRSGVWVTPNCTPQFTGDRPGTGFEAVEIAHAPGRSRWNGGGRPAVWVVNRPANGTAERAVGHPTPKPVDLMRALVADFSDAGDIICDPFTGSGTTGVAALYHGRRFVGWELNPKYHAAASRRLEETREQANLFPSMPRTAQLRLID